MRSSTTRRFARAAAAAALSVTATAAAQTPPTREQCADAYVAGQRLRRDGRLIGARDALILCARDPCPGAFQPECTAWLDEVTKVIPSIVVRARAPKAEALTRVRVSIDHRVVTERLDGREIELDPGERLLRIEAEGMITVEQRILINQGERSRVLTFDLAPRPAPRAATPQGEPHAEPKGGTPWLAHGFVGLGIFGVLGFASFGIAGLSKRSELDDSCKPHCKPTEVDAGKRSFLVADISLGVAVLSGGIATYLYLRDRR